MTDEALGVRKSPDAAAETEVSEAIATPIYLDYAATTPVDVRVAEVMNSCLTAEGNFGNPASRSHLYGWRAEEAVENARAQVAALFNADPREIVWTSGATESDNLAIKGVALHPSRTGRHIVTSAIEHKAVLDTCAWLETQGFTVTYIKPTSSGLITPAMVADALQPDTILISIMHANNETGVVNDLRGIGEVARANKVLFHTDAAQSAGKLPLDTQDLPVDLISLSAHKIYGPKGIGVLYVRREPAIPLAAQIHGGGHERGMRSGTLPTHQIVGLGEAARLCIDSMEQEGERILGLRQRLWSRLSQCEGSHANGDLDAHLPGILNVGFDDVEGETLLMALDDLAVSSGSACMSASVEPSYVLRAMGVPDARAFASLRFSMGRHTNEAQIDFAAARVLEVVTRLRS